MTSCVELSELASRCDGPGRAFVSMIACASAGLNESNIASVALLRRQGLNEAEVARVYNA